MPRYRIMGTTDAVTSCEVCGRTGLKKTVVLRELDGGHDDLHAGTDCAGRLLGWGESKVGQAKVAKAARNADELRPYQRFLMAETGVRIDSRTRKGENEAMAAYLRANPQLDHAAREMGSHPLVAIQNKARAAGYR